MKWLQKQLLPTNILLEVIVGTIMTFFVMFLWYITQPIAIGCITTTKSIADNLGLSNTYLNNGVTILTWIEYWWGPLLVITMMFLWIYLASGRQEWESHMHD